MNASQLVICPKCGEAFSIDKIEQHVRTCPGRQLHGTASVSVHPSEHEMKEGGA